MTLDLSLQEASMLDHLRRRWGLRVVLTLLAPLLGWAQATENPEVRAFMVLWVVAAVIGTVGHRFPGWGVTGERFSALPQGLQGLLAGLVLGAFVVLLARGDAVVASVGYLFALPALFDLPRFRRRQGEGVRAGGHADRSSSSAGAGGYADRS